MYATGVKLTTSIAAMTTTVSKKVSLGQTLLRLDGAASIHNGGDPIGANVVVFGKLHSIALKCFPVLKLICWRVWYHLDSDSSKVYKWPAQRL